MFSGCGGLSLGLQASGIEIVHAFDSWLPAIKTYQANLDHPCNQMDLSDIEGTLKRLNPIDFNMIVGGPPCQDFSHAGKREEGARASLTGCFADIVCRSKPKVFIMENVDRAQNSNAYAAARVNFNNAGYHLVERTLNAALCGVPQLRKRFFCIGLRSKSLATEVAGLLDSRLSEREMTVREYMHKELDVTLYYRHPRNYSRRAIYSINEPAPTMRGVNRPVPAGYPGHPGDAGKKSKSLRPLTTIERSRIQTFPRGFQWVGTKTDVEQMIGNAVPVALACFVGTAVCDAFAMARK
ncbi:MAG: DNA cytosine methyltransferase [Planctomycetes bacterium]|nr:DNA cytosine methyltransferase [Planctomycetota bacterium]